MTRAEYIDIVEKNADMVYRIAFSYFGSKADSEDVMQEVFLKLHNCDRIPESDSARKAWLIRVTTNQCHSLFRSPFRKRRVWLTDYEWDSFADEGSLEDEITRRHAVYTAVMSQPAKYRIIIHLYYYEDLSVAQIASLLHVKETTVQTRLARARDKLKVMLKDDMFL